MIAARPAGDRAQEAIGFCCAGLASSVPFETLEQPADVVEVNPGTQPHGSRLDPEGRTRLNGRSQPRADGIVDNGLE